MPRTSKGGKASPKRSKKAHITPPPRELPPHLAPEHEERRDTGQFTGEGSSGLEKK